MDSPLISVILPTHNGSRYIREAIESVLTQDYQNIELIIIDDASTDMTPQIIEEYLQKDKRIILLKNEKNLKLVATLNRWISIAKGKFIARIDDDDIWSDAMKLTKQMQVFIKHPGVALVGTGAEIIDDFGKKTGNIIRFPTDSVSVKRGFGLRNQLIHTSILVKRDVLIEAGLYKNDWLYVEDFDLWLRILARGYEIMNLSDLAVSYRVREGNTTNKKYHRMQWLTFFRLYRDTSIFPSFIRRWMCLFIRLILIILPPSIVRFLK